MEEYINADPITYEHHKLFEYLQRQCLDWRLNDPYASLVSWKWKYRLNINYNIYSKSYFRNLQLSFIQNDIGMVHSRSNVCAR